MPAINKDYWQHAFDLLDEDEQEWYGNADGFYQACRAIGEAMSARGIARVLRCPECGKQVTHKAEFEWGHLPDCPIVGGGD